MDDITMTVEVDGDYKMDASTEAVEPNIDEMFLAPPESTADAMKEAGII